MQRKVIVLDGEDTVATALSDLGAGDTVELQVNGKPIIVTATDPITFGHKFSVFDIKAGSRILKHGEAIGEATQDIKAGELVRVQNTASVRARGDLAAK